MTYIYIFINTYIYIYIYISIYIYTYIIIPNRYQRNQDQWARFQSWPGKTRSNGGHLQVLCWHSIGSPKERVVGFRGDGEAIILVALCHCWWAGASVAPKGIVYQSPTFNFL